MSGKTTTTILAGTLLIAGCGERPGVDPPAITEPQDDLGPVARLWRDAVTPARFAKKTLYTWTTSEQIEELRKARVLLSREVSPERGASYYEQVIHSLSSRNAIAKLLDTTTYAKSRFAWVAPWATRMGWPHEQYGDQLVRVVLKDDAIVLALSTTTGAFEAHDLRDQPIDEATVLAHPERIAAVYFMAFRDKAIAGIPYAPNTYREYVLCNESMIASWSVGTADIRAEIDATAIALDALADYVRDRPQVPPGERASRDMQSIDEVARGYASALAFENALYKMEPTALRAIATQLRGTQRPAVIEGGGTSIFPGLGARRVIEPAPRRGGTYYGTHFETY